MMIEWSRERALTKLSSSALLPFNLILKDSEKQSTQKISERKVEPALSEGDKKEERLSNREIDETDQYPLVMSEFIWTVYVLSICDSCFFTLFSLLHSPSDENFSNSPFAHISTFTRIYNE